MQTLRFTALIFLLLSAFCLNAQPLTKHVLFLGNSYTYFNDMPQMVASMATSAGDTLIYDMNAPGGYTLNNHYDNPVSTGKIEAGGWDYVVLQEQSQLPSFEVYDFYAGMQLSAISRIYNQCARALFYMTWGRENGDASNCDFLPWVCTYEGMDSMLRLRYTEMGQASKAEVSPVGAVWRYVKQNYPAIDLYQADGSHPTLTGSYLVACCFYTSVFKKDPTLVTFASTLDPTQASLIRNATKAILYDSLAQWDFTPTYPIADFSFIVGSSANEVNFSNLSEDADFYSWDFGDGDTSTEEHPTHTFASNGIFTVTLTVTNCDQSGNYESTYQVNIGFCTHTPDITPDSLVLCPNSNDTLWTQPGDAYQWFDNNVPIPGATNQFILAQPNTLYSVATTVGGCTELSVQEFVGYYNSTPFIVTAVGENVVTGGVSFFACTGDTAHLWLAPTKPPFPYIDPYVQWYLDGEPIPGSANDSLMVTEAGVYGVTLESALCPGYTVVENFYLNFVFEDCTTQTPDVDAQQAIYVYPTPASHFVTLANETNENIDFTIVDAMGRTITGAALKTGNNLISIGDFAGGVYFVTFDKPTRRPIKLIKL